MSDAPMDDPEDDWWTWTLAEHVQQFRDDANALELALNDMRSADSGEGRASASFDLGRFIDDVRVRADYLMRRLADEGLIDPVYGESDDC
jgi:hypothetical protein